MVLMKFNFIENIIRSNPFVYISLLLICPLFITAAHVLLDSEAPVGDLIEPPLNHDPLSEGFILIILDGVGENWLLSEEHLPLINSKRDTGATLYLRTSPLTLSATCVSEIMTGVPNSPSDGLRNFDLSHPGGDDAWTLASEKKNDENISEYGVGLVGSYVFGNMYGKNKNIDFTDTFLGHSDYYKGDEDTADLLHQWLDNDTYNVIGAHFSGPDKVGHRWGTVGDKYEDKLSHVDKLVSDVIKVVPDNWTIVITADHGMTKLGTHGSSQDITRNVAALVWGPLIIEGSEADGHQRDLAALAIATLDLSFPVQLHGRIPLDILDLSISTKDDLEMWNWLAAYERQDFLESIDRPAANNLQVDVIDWDKISIDAEFTRFIDVFISVSTWSILAATALFLIGMNTPNNTIDRKATALFLVVLVSMIISHAFLGIAAVLPRSIGAISSMWIVWWSLGNIKENKNDYFYVNRIYNRLIKSLPKWWPWLAASLVMTFSSLRFWFILIPLTWILLGNKTLTKNNNAIQKLPLIILGIISLIGIIGVHERLVGDHWVLALVQTGWPDTIFNILFSILILTITGPFHQHLINPHGSKLEGYVLSGWLLLILFVNWIGDTSVDRVFLIIILLFGIFGMAQRANLISEGIIKIFGIKDLDIAALGALLVLTWGAWSAVMTILLISSIDALMRTEWKWISIEKHSLYNPRPFIAAAILPLAIWILWWTMLGQVNGLEAWGLPHPRELDPGRLIVRGGYVGARDNPPTEWMTLLIFLPLLLSSTAIISRLKERGLSLQPYAIALSLQLIGCFATLAFSPPYPRLIFSLTWNIVFSSFQILALLLAILFTYISKNPRNPTIL